ncbi:hypothetical protein SAMN05421636_11072 [Pricia antarctica]|uniref:Uncharacterized protein n=1 Tax=Pricia antarctica TaxID=641691 RepID=A0A1G7HW54_9FLAO|nr:hypothetical protein SAMN05421636_11072 [Pricia antarctica]
MLFLSTILFSRLTRIETNINQIYYEKTIL